jgi:hypothetical protein
MYFKGYVGNVLWTSWRYYPRIFLEGPRKTTRNHGQHRWSPGSSHKSYIFSCQQYITTVVEEALVNNLGIKASHNMQFTQCHEYKMKDFFIIISGPLKVTAHPVPLTLTPLLIQ